MNGRVGRSLTGIVTVALSLLIVIGPVTAALADGGPDRALPVCTDRVGFGDRIGATDHPADCIPPSSRHVQAPATRAARAPAAGSSTSWRPLGLLLGAVVLAMAATFVMVQRRRRTLAI